MIKTHLEVLALIRLDSDDDHIKQSLNISQKTLRDRKKTLAETLGCKVEDILVITLDKDLEAQLTRLRHG